MPSAIILNKVQHGGVTIHQGSVLDVLPTLPAAHFHTCVTSPPYWGLLRRALRPPGGAA